MFTVAKLSSRLLKLMVKIFNCCPKWVFLPLSDNFFCHNAWLFELKNENSNRLLEAVLLLAN